MRHVLMDFDFQKVKDNLQCFNRPIYETIIVTLIEMIESGELPAGTKFPPDKKLAIELGISHITLAKALNELRRRNILDRRRATGTSVPEIKNLPEANKARKKIAVVFDYASEQTFQQSLFINLYKGLEQLNCSLCFFSADNSSEKQLSILQEILNDFSISGCIVWSILNAEQAKKIIRMRPRYYPLIFLDRHYEGFDHDAVTYPNFDCAAALARSLRRRKIKSCCWVENREKHVIVSDADRRNGFLSVWQADVEFKLLQLPDETEDYAEIQIPEAEAYVCSDNQLALQFKYILTSRGELEGKKLFVIESPGDDHEKVKEFTAYKFTPGMGDEAIKILSSRLNGKECSTVSHSGKWSVLEGKNPTRRKIYEKMPPDSDM